MENGKTGSFADLTSDSDQNSIHLEQFVNCQRSLYGYVFSLVGSSEAADEILQETNLLICKKINQFDGKVKFITWACEIARYKVLEYQKKTQLRNLSLDMPLLEQIAKQAAQLASQVDWRLPLLRECMEELSPKDRKLIEDRYSQGATVQSLAEARKRSSGGIRVALHRIRTMLLECVEWKLIKEEQGHA
ncbi:MAG: sigma-70 family RNA polymerase sigma factor [Thermoguttaceae bacterium]